MLMRHRHKPSNQKDSETTGRPSFKKIRHLLNDIANAYRATISNHARTRRARSCIARNSNIHFGCNFKHFVYESNLIEQVAHAGLNLL